jgi:2-oxoglutarate dehydrogenase E1 component
MQVANCTTPANYFHILRRQLKRDFRKPLIIMTPKSLLRHKRCTSEIEDMLTGRSFHRVFEETDPKIAKKSKRIVICSGKVYYDLLEEREKREIDNVSLVRLEQIYPFPFQTLKKILSAKPDAEVIWCQEEPHNMGAWLFVEEKLEEVMIDAGCKKFKRPRYVGRPEAASPATGSLSRHLKEQEKLILEALDVTSKVGKKAAE